jgi:hydroxymethylpyrimidine/phosphomethylpyrimidine kinase
MEKEKRLPVLSIAGFDPSGGAGILADIKTFEANKLLGLGVCTAITFQNDQEFDGVQWVPSDEIQRQIEVLARRFSLDWVKIGLIENLPTLKLLIQYLKELNPEVKIIWDPIFKASAGFVFHSQLDREDLTEICKDITLLTPNLDEINKMFPDMSPESGADYLSQYCNILLKGGHDAGDKARDLLFANGLITIYESDRMSCGKHGTGCVLSSAILTNLAKGYDIKDACREGKEYVTDFIKSDSGLLGLHYV